MNAPTIRKFPHHLDWNGVYHSICLDCYSTVATSYNENMLSEEENHHRCEEMPGRRGPARDTSAAHPLSRAS